MSDVHSQCENEGKKNIWRGEGGREGGRERMANQRDGRRWRGQGVRARLEQTEWEVTACKFFAGQYFEGWGVWELDRHVQQIGEVRLCVWDMQSEVRGRHMDINCELRDRQ